MLGRARFAVIAGLSVASCLVAVSATGAGASSSPSIAHPATQRMTTDPLVKRLAGRAIGGSLPCQTAALGSALGRCYSPAEIQKAYNVSPLLAHGYNGAGRTIVIVDAYSNPDMGADLASFDAQFGLPAANFTEIAPLGLTPFDPTDPDQVGWASEIALDVEWSHAIAPEARIVLAEAPSDYDVPLMGTVKWVIDHNVGDVVSMSFVETEGCTDPDFSIKTEHAMFNEATAKHITLVAGSGDSGAAVYDCDYDNAIEGVSTPNSDPNVTSIGGTNLNATDNGTYVSEAAWDDQFLCNSPSDAVGDGCSGGGFSTLYRRPLYQLLTPHTKPAARGVPDVALDAGVDGGVLVACGECSYVAGLPDQESNFWVFGGTSCGGPQWAGLVAIADQLGRHRVGLMNPALYAIARNPVTYRLAFHDVTHGNNRDAEIDGAGYDTSPGWDPVTGLGTPNAANLIPLVAALAH